jgi:hypothetical protein
VCRRIDLGGRCGDGRDRGWNRAGRGGRKRRREKGEARGRKKGESVCVRERVCVCICGEERLTRWSVFSLSLSLSLSLSECSPSLSSRSRSLSRPLACVRARALSQWTRQRGGVLVVARASWRQTVSGRRYTHIQTHSHTNTRTHTHACVCVCVCVCVCEWCARATILVCWGLGF